MRLIVVLFMGLFISFLTAASIEEGSYEYYLESLIQEAVENINALPQPTKDVYTEYLEKYNDIIMAFILAKEESSKLLLADPPIVLDHYYAVTELYEREKDRYSIPFFLSYIAKITVTEERITPYRELFAKHGLYNLPDQYPKLYDLVREVNLWTRRFMTFQPTSGRDMAPVDIMERTNIGRCEEMMIYFISAARALGIPARPASTPYWGHTDNNHAWVEVYVDGRWWHLGAVEPAYHLDDAWFSANAAKAIIITATAAFPDSNDIVVGQRGYVSVINSTPYYDTEETKARNVKVTVKNENNEVVPDSRIALQVFNWGSLRPILHIAADDQGEAELVTGNGAFFISAYDDSLSLYDIHKVPADKDNYHAYLTLREPAELDSFSAKLTYRDRKTEKLPPSDDWEDRRKAVREEYNRLVESYQKKEIPLEQPDSLFLEVWEATRNNKDNLLEFYLENEPEETFIYLLTKVDPKFLWQASVEQFELVYENYGNLMRDDLPDEAVVAIISATVFFEEIATGKLDDNLLRWRGDEDAISEIIAYLNDKYEVDNEKAVQTFQMPANVLMRLPYLTHYQLKILACAVLNGNHIPARYTRMADVITVYHNGSWKYYDISENSFLSDEESEKQTYNVEFRTVDEHGYPVDLSAHQTTLTFLRNGLFLRNETPISVKDDGMLTAALEDGNYQLHIGYRPSSSLTYFTLKNINIDGQVVEETIVLEAYPREWMDVTDEIGEIAEIIDEELDSSGEVAYFLLGVPDSEMTRRLALRLAEQAEEDKYLWVGSNYSPDTPDFYRVLESLKDTAFYSQERQRIITLKRDKDSTFTYYEGIWDRLP